MRIITEPFKAGDNYWSYNAGGNTSTLGVLPPDGTRHWTCNSGGNIGDPGNQIPLPNMTAIRLGFYFRPNGIAGGNHIMIGFKNGLTSLFTIRQNLSVNNRLEIRNAAEVILSAGTNQIFDGAWRHLGVEYDLHASAGLINVYLDNILEMSYSGNTGLGQTFVNNIQVARCFNTVNASESISSLYVNDTSGPAPSNAFEGVVKMYQLLPASDSVISNYIKSAGSTAWNLLNNVPPNLATLVSSMTNGQQQFVIPAAHGLVAPSFIRAVTARWIMSKATGGRVNPGFRFNGSSVINSTDRDLQVSPHIVLERKTINNVGANIALGDTIEVGLTTVIP